MSGVWELIHGTAKVTWRARLSVLWHYVIRGHVPNFVLTVWAYTDQGKIQLNLETVTLTKKGTG